MKFVNFVRSLLRKRRHTPVKKEPLVANATVRYSPELTKQMKNSTEGTPTGFSHLPQSGSTKKIWIYNLSRLGLQRSAHPVVGDINIPGRELDQPYSVWTSFPETLVVFRKEPDNGQVLFDYTDGRRLAMDIVNPDNLGLDQNVTVPSTSGGTNNFGDKGVFWSENNPPTKAELLLARKRMRERYKMLLEQLGTKIFVTGMSFNDKVKTLVKEYNKPWGTSLKPKVLKQMAVDKLLHQLNVTPEHHVAAEFFGLKTEWHPVLLDKKQSKTQETHK